MTKGDNKLFISRFPPILVATALVYVLQGCTAYSIWGYGPDSQTREEFEHRVETAFRLQNRMTSEVMMIQSDGSNTQHHVPIIQAEQIMEMDCSHLNEYASREIDGLNKSLLLLKRVENSVADCEASAQKVEELLKSHQR